MFHKCDHARVFFAYESITVQLYNHYKRVFLTNGHMPCSTAVSAPTMTKETRRALMVTATQKTSAQPAVAPTSPCRLTCLGEINLHQTAFGNNMRCLLGDSNRANSVEKTLELHLMPSMSQSCQGKHYSRSTEQLANKAIIYCTFIFNCAMPRKRV